MNARRKWLLALSPVFLFGLASCGSKSVAPTAPNDSTAPFVVSMVPGSNETGIDVDASITVIFSEAMDPSTAAGNVTLSSGTITGLAWSDARTLVISHTGWAEGVKIDVTIGTGVTDLAGNGIEASFAANFWTMSSVVQFLSSNPADGVTNATRNPQVMMLFSHPMNLVSLNVAVTVTDVTNANPIAYNLVQGQNTWIAMTFPSNLPASTIIRVNISTAAQSATGSNLATAASFTFATGADIDTEAPTLLSVVPANGSVIGAGTGSIRLTFSEAINTNEFSPSTISAQFWMLLESSGAEPVWSENNTVLTVALPTPLPAGLPITVSFATYQDLSGNVQTTPLSYAVTVSGTPDYFPMADGMVHEYLQEWEEQVPGSATLGGTRSEWVRVEQDATNEFRMVRYPSEAFVTPDEWEFYRRTATTIDFMGFHEGGGSGGSDVMFTVPITYSKIPWSVQSWGGSTQAPTSEGTVDVSYSVSVIAQEDLNAITEGSETVVWKNCWKAVLNYSLSAAGESQGSGTETMWFAPTVGIVKHMTVENETSGQVYTTEDNLVMP